MKVHSVGTLICVFLCSRLALGLDIHFLIIHMKTRATQMCSTLTSVVNVGYKSSLM